MEKKKYIYLDNAASASSSDFCVGDDFANPNSLHDLGRDSFQKIEEARIKMLEAIGAKRPSEIVFTSGATEANNSLIFGIARAAAKKRGFIDKFGIKDKSNLPRVITSIVEHESVYTPVCDLNNWGFEVVVLPVDKGGFVNPEALKEMINKNTVLVSIQSSNTEIGSIQNIKKLCEIAHNSGACFHTDAVGSFGKIPFDVSDLKVDAASFSGHKIGGPKGIGVMYLKSNTPFQPLILGSVQEHSKRAGTQNTAGIISMGLAVDECMRNINDTSKRLSALRDFLYKNINKIRDVELTVPQSYANSSYLPHVCSLLFRNSTSNDVIMYLNKKGIEVSGGSACGEHDNKKFSRVLKAIGVSQTDTLGAIRVSFGLMTTKQDVEKFIEEVINFYKDKER